MAYSTINYNTMAQPPKPVGAGITDRIMGTPPAAPQTAPQASPPTAPQPAPSPPPAPRPATNQTLGVNQLVQSISNSNAFKEASKRASSPYGDYYDQFMILGDNPNPEDVRALWGYANALGSNPKYKGSREIMFGLIGQYANMLRQNRQSMNDMDYSGISKLGDYYSGAGNRLAEVMAAQGIGGSGIAAGAMSNLAGRQQSAIGDYIREIREQRRREALARQMEMDRYTREIMAQGYGEHIKDEQDPGFWGDALGVLGGVGGAFLGGPGGAALGKGIVDAVF